MDISPGFYVAVSVTGATALIVLVVAILWCCVWRTPRPSSSSSSEPFVHRETTTIIQADGNRYTIPLVRVHDTMKEQ